MLTTCAAGPIGVDPDIVHIQIDLVIALDFRQNFYQRKRRVAAVGRIERR